MQAKLEKRVQTGRRSQGAFGRGKGRGVAQMDGEWSDDQRRREQAEEIRTDEQLIVWVDGRGVSPASTQFRCCTGSSLAFAEKGRARLG